MEHQLFPRFKASSFFDEIDINAAKTRIFEGIDDARKEKAAMQDIDSLDTFLTNQNYRKYFTSYCQETFCAENIYFWLDCEDFKHIPSDDLLKVVAQKIYRKYVGHASKNQVNLKANIVREIEKALPNPTRTLYDNAQAEICRLMESDTFAKFKKSQQMEDARRASMQAIRAMKGVQGK